MDLKEILGKAFRPIKKYILLNKLRALLVGCVLYF